MSGLCNGRSKCKKLDPHDRSGTTVTSMQNYGLCNASSHPRKARIPKHAMHILRSFDKHAQQRRYLRHFLASGVRAKNQNTPQERQVLQTFAFDTKTENTRFLHIPAQSCKQRATQHSGTMSSFLAGDVVVVVVVVVVAVAVAVVVVGVVVAAVLRLRLTDAVFKVLC